MIKILKKKCQSACQSGRVTKWIGDITRDVPQLSTPRIGVVSVESIGDITCRNFPLPSRCAHCLVCRFHLALSGM